MLRRTLALVMGAGLVVGGFSLTLLSAAQDSPLSGHRSSATAQAQPAPQGDLSTLAGAGKATTGVGFVEPQTKVFVDDVPLDVAEARNAEIRAAQLAARGGKPRPFVPVPVGAEAKPADPGEPTEAAPADRPVDAPNDMTFFFSHPITSAEVPTSQRSTIMEPTVVNLDDGVFYTGNWFAAKSINGGSTFSYINPYTFFPSVNGGFCCDQVTAYAPDQDMAIWGLQYIEDGTTNTLRIARAIGSAGIAANNWTYWNFTPQMVGFATGVWFDYPSMTVAGNSLYVTSNAFTTSTYAFAGSVIMRLPLAGLAAGTGFGFGYFRSNIGTERVTEGAGSTIYWAGFNTTTQMRIFNWAEGSGSINWNDVNLNAFNWLSRDGVATSPDGTNWALRADSRPTGAYVAGGVIGVMWSAKQGGSFPKPYTVHARFNETTRALITQGAIWNSSYAWMYPAVHPDAAGNLGGSLQIGGAASGTGAYPSPTVWVTDDLTGASPTIGGAWVVTNGTDGPNNNAWGDYFSVRPHKTRPNSWVAATHTLQGGGNGPNTVPNYLWFGRERDNPIEAAMTSPTPGSTLPGASATFTWSAGRGATEYYLYMGTTGVGSTNILAESQGLNLSRLVTNLPTTNGTLYVRLWTYMPAISDWEYTDYTYVTIVPPVAAAITSPAPGSTLPGASATFTWNTGVGSLEYWLHVGTSGVGSSNIWNESQGLNLSRTVTGLPTTGGTVYVRLWTLSPLGWVFRDYTYIAFHPIGAPGDYNGDGKSDILWRHETNGEVWLWAMNGAVRTAQIHVGTVADTNWEIRGDGDQNGDGKADILWRNRTTGEIYLWPMNGATVLSQTYVATVGPAYDIVGTGDYNGDGKSDILWRQLTTGDVWIWLMNGATPLSQVYIDTVDPRYAVVGSGDLNGDAKADIVFHHGANGQVWVWLMNGTTRISQTNIGTVGDVGYKIVGVADHTGDGKADLLWHHATRGEVYIWPMNGTTVVSQTYVDRVSDARYRIVGTGDYNGDTKADILWHHATLGEVWVWLMNGTTRISQTLVATVPVNVLFDSQFNGSAPGWFAHTGGWSVGAQYLTAAGIANTWTSASNTGTFSNFDYEAPFTRTGCASCSNSLLIRGTPDPLATNGRWDNGYLFNYTTSGDFSVWKVVAGVEINLAPWVTTPAIIQGAAAWNTLRVVANGTSLSFYINGTLVWSGADGSFASGRVGVASYSDAGGGSQVWVDYAVLRAGSYLVVDTLGAEQQGLKEAAQPESGSMSMEQSKK